jgi:hypothetical protein
VVLLGDEGADPVGAEVVVHPAPVFLSGQQLHLIGREGEAVGVPVGERGKSAVQCRQLDTDVVGLAPVGLLQTLKEMVPGHERGVALGCVAAHSLLAKVLGVDGARQGPACTAEDQLGSTCTLVDEERRRSPRAGPPVGSSLASPSASTSKA